MTAFIIIVGVILLLILLYLLVLIRTYPRTPHDERVLCDYAHRGLHGTAASETAVPENSLAAFKLAAEKGYGIELDIQLSRDGEVMVFHDYSLERMTGREGKLCDYSADELCAMTLCGTEERIPRFAEVLKLVDGRVPLLIELKGESLSTELCGKAAKLLSSYGGAYCIESFNPLLLGKMAKLMPNIYHGILYTNVCKNKKRYTPLNIAVSIMATNIIAKPNFVAYDEKYRNSLAVKLAVGLFGAARFVWTQKDAESFCEAKTYGENSIFEGFCAKM